ncbi:glutamate racemase [Blattabacterium cuenoti]|uniref:glutamate racemase n=1 Tax=Blattabacterium cuenoti TaxID=1653831 RepID=UPI00163CBC1E|nr:glutamate racemase [Blattabacterium cuenoti]
MKNKYPIGILDSGIGGLIIAKEIKIQMPNENLIYFGDNINMPYGNKSKKFIVDNAIKIISFLYEKKCKALVIACNSITSNALDIILEKFKNKILIFNVIDPIIKNNILLSYKKIGIISTPSTIRSNFYFNKIKYYYHHLDIVQLSIPLLAFFIENDFNIKKIIDYIRNYLIHLRSIDILILACTHYLYIKNEIYKFYKKKVYLIDIQKIVVEEIKKKLIKKSLLSLKDKSDIQYPIFYHTSNKNNFFQKKVQLLFGNKVFIEQHKFN